MIHATANYSAPAQEIAAAHVAVRISKKRSLSLFVREAVREKIQRMGINSELFERELQITIQEQLSRRTEII